MACMAAVSSDVFTLAVHPSSWPGRCRSLFPFVSWRCAGWPGQRADKTGISWTGWQAPILVCEGPRRLVRALCHVVGPSWSHRRDAALGGTHVCRLPRAHQTEHIPRGLTSSRAIIIKPLALPVPLASIVLTSLPTPLYRYPLVLSITSTLAHSLKFDIQPAPRHTFIPSSKLVSSAHLHYTNYPPNQHSPSCDALRPPEQNYIF